MANRRLTGDSSTPCLSCISPHSSRDSQESWATFWVDGPSLPCSLLAADSRCRLARLIPVDHSARETRLHLQPTETPKTRFRLPPTGEATRSTTQRVRP